MEKVYYNAPKKIVDLNLERCENKAKLPLPKMILMGIMAGIFIALGGATSSTAVHAIDNVGLARTLAGAVFPIGLMLIVFLGGELFTGNGLIIMAVLDKRVTFRQMFRNLVVVYFSNYVGAMIINYLLIFSGNLNYSDGRMGAYLINTAFKKMSITPLQGITSGILCNILVCLAIMMATASTDIAGKIWAIFFPIWAFVIAGFEHCIANMYYIPIGIMATHNADYVEKAQEIYGMTLEQIEGMSHLGSLRNFIPVTLGNLIGGVVFVGVVSYLIHKKDWGKKA